MKYKVRSIEGHFVTVDYEDGRWATAQVHHNTKPEDIDKIFGQFTGEFELTKRPTERIVIGEERETTDPNPETAESEKVIDYDQLAKEKEAAKTPDPFRVDIGTATTYVDGLPLLLLGQLLAEQGKPALKQCMDAKLQAIIDNPEFSVDTLIEKLNDTL